MHLTRETVLVIVCVCYCGCSSSPSPHFIPTQITLYSIRGGPGSNQGTTPDTERFCGFPVLGKIDVTDTKKCRVIIDGLHDAIDRRPKDAPACFNPRHGLRWKENGKTREFVICFECSRFWEFEEGKQVRSDKIDYSLEKLLTGMLKAANIPMEPGPNK